MKKFIILFLCFITGCGINCIEGSKGISSHSLVVEVEPIAKKVSGKLQPSWIDTGLVVDANQPPMKLKITGAVNMCIKDSLNPKEIIVPANPCSGGVSVDYKDESIYKDREKMCKNGTTVSKDKIDDFSVFTLSKGDMFRVSLVPRKVMIEDCSADALKKLGIIYYSDHEIFQDNACKNAVKAEEICKNGISRFYIKMGDKCQLLGRMGGIPRLQGTEISILVDNTDNPYGNKVFYGENSKDNWIRAPFVYNAKLINNNFNVETLKKHCNVIKELNKKLSSKNSDLSILQIDSIESYKKQVNNKQQITNHTITSDEEIKEIIDVMNSFTAYDINCVCGTIANAEAHFIDNNKIATISNSNVDGNCRIGNSHYNADTSLENIQKDIKVEQKIYGLSAFFDTKGSTGNARNNIKPDFDYVYEHDNSGILKFKIANGSKSSKAYSGGYHIRVERICNVAYGKKLYMYIGDDAPTMLPGEAGTIELFAPGSNNEDNKDLKSETGVYVINSDNAEKKSGKIYLGIDVRGYEDQLDYNDLPVLQSDNRYYVNFFVKRWSPNFSKAFVMIRDSLLRILYGLPKGAQVSNISQAMDVVRVNNSKGAVQHIYTSQTSAGSLWSALQALCTLYIIFTVFGYMIGVIRCTKYDLGVRIAKIAMIVGLISQGSWEFFSDHFFSMFVQGVSDLISAFNGELDGDNSFAFLDPTIGVLLTGEVWIRLLTLIITGPIGWLVFFMILWAVVVFFICIIEAVIAYLLTIVAIAFLATLAPIFITFIFFQLTKTLFDGWIKMLVNFSLQPIILFAALAFLNQVMLTTLHEVTRYTVCKQCFLGFDLPSSVIEEGAPPDICILSFLLPVGYAPELSINDSIREANFRGGAGFLGLPFGITSVFMLLLVANAMKGFRRMSETIAHSISGSIANLSASIYGAVQSLASIVGLDQETQNIIKNAMKNRKSTAKSTVNIVSRTDTNPENQVEPMKIEDHDSSTDTDNKGRNDSDSSLGMANTSDVSQQTQLDDDVVRKREVTGSTKPSIALDDGILDTVRSSYVTDNGVDKISPASGSSHVSTDDINAEKDTVRSSYVTDNGVDKISPASGSSHVSTDDINAEKVESHDVSHKSLGSTSQDIDSADDTHLTIASEDSAIDSVKTSDDDSSDVDTASQDIDSADDTHLTIASEDSAIDSVKTSDDDSSDVDTASRDIDSADDTHLTIASEDSAIDSIKTSDDDSSDVDTARDIDSAENSNLDPGNADVIIDDTDSQIRKGKVLSAVESSDDAGNSSKKKRSKINFLDHPRSKRLYMDENSSVAEKIKGHESAIKEVQESQERATFRRTIKNKQDKEE